MTASDIVCQPRSRLKQGFGFSLPPMVRFRSFVTEPTPRAIGILLVLAIFFFLRPLILGETFFFRDLFLYFVPHAKFAGSFFRLLQVPFWNPYCGFGKPFAADPQAAAFYPLHVVFYVMPPAAAVNIYGIVHLWLTGTGMLLIARRWGLDVFPAIVAGVAAMFSTLVVSALEFHLNCATITWTPYVFLAANVLADRATTAPTWRSPGIGKAIVPLALVLTIQYFAGYPEFVAYSGAMAFTYGFGWAAFRAGLSRACLFAAAFTGAGCLAILFALPQLLMTIEFLGQAERAQGVDPGYTMASLTPAHLWGFLLPFAHGRPGYPDTWWGGSVFEYWVGTAYVGILPLMLCCLLPWAAKEADWSTPRSPAFFRCMFLSSAAVFGLLMAFGNNTPVYPLLHAAVPGLRFFRFPSKFLTLYVFATCLLAGYGYNFLREWSQRCHSAKRSAALVVAAWTAVVACLGVAASRSPHALFRFLIGDASPGTPSALALQTTDVWSCVVFTLASAAVIIGLARSRHIAMDVLAVAVLTANLFWVSQRLHGVVPSQLYRDTPPIAVTSPLHSHDSRVHSAYGGIQQWLYGNRDPRLTHWAINAGVGDIWLSWNVRQTWQGGMKLRGYLAIYGLLTSLPPAGIERIADVASIDTVVWGAPAEQICWQQADRQVMVTPRDTALPRAFLVDGWRIEQDENRILQALFEIDPTSTAVVSPSEESAIPYSNVRDGTAWARQVEWLEDEPLRQRIRVSTTKPAILVVNDAWYPAWHAEVDGAKHDICRVNYHFRGVFVSPGEHMIEFRYRPSAFHRGLLGTVAASLICFALALVPPTESRQ